MSLDLEESDNASMTTSSVLHLVPALTSKLPDLQTSGGTGLREQGRDDIYLPRSDTVKQHLHLNIKTKYEANWPPRHSLVCIYTRRGRERVCDEEGTEVWADFLLWLPSVESRPELQADVS